jgi:hypothetical protein
VECKEQIERELPEISNLELSMGMSGGTFFDSTRRTKTDFLTDFEDAIRAGSTNVRIGSTLFGARP